MEGHDQQSPGGVVAPPDTVGRYRVEGPLGAGGMGVVYRGFDPELRRPVALKRVHPAGTDGKAVRRLRREAQVLARLSHPSIAQIYDVLEGSGTLWIVLELIEGASLLKLQRRRRVSTADRIRCFIKIGEGLAAAHGRGVLHRDLKHENVLVTADWEVKILDFGLAISRHLSTETLDGRLAGTARAMSPEQILGEALDPRSDLFAFGVLIYESIAERSPFQGETVAATVHRVLTEHPPPLVDAVPGTSAALSELVESLISKDPADRPGDAQAAVERLGSILSALSSEQAWDEQSTVDASAWTVDKDGGSGPLAPSRWRGLRAALALVLVVIG
ncbi:MAG: serine/threonine-protein kinase, partial [Acidobacteriota bacterium]